MQLTYDDSMRAVLGLSTTRQRIERLEAEIRQMPQADIPTEHTHGPGFYARTITIPAGGVLTGKVHATEHIFFVSKGDITLVTDEGRKRVQAPYQAICKAGIKRAGFAHSETVCTNVHITAETDLQRLEALLIAPEKHLELESK
jgi:quercetin dioxygenase-like cupin family protein